MVSTGFPVLSLNWHSPNDGLRMEVKIEPTVMIFVEIFSLSLAFDLDCWERQIHGLVLNHVLILITV